MTWMFTSSFQILTSCVYLRTKLTKKLNRNLTEEENSSKWSKLLSQVKVTIKRKRIGWQRMIRKVFVKKKSEWILRFQIYLEKCLCFALPFAVYKDQRSSSQTHTARNMAFTVSENPRLIFENAAFCYNSLTFSGRKIHSFPVVFWSVNLSIRSIIR